MLRKTKRLAAALPGAIAMIAAAQIPPVPLAEPTPTVVTTPAPAPSATPVPLPGLVPPARAEESIPPVALTLPKGNPYGAAVETLAGLPPKIVFSDAIVEASLFVSVRVDRTGKATHVRIARDPIPSLARLSQSSLARWSFEPAKMGGQPADAWTSFRIDLAVEVDAPRLERQSLTPVGLADPLPAPEPRGRDADWYERIVSAPPEDGTPAPEKVQAGAIPKKTRWDADTYKGPFSGRWWVRVDPNGKIDRVIPLEISEAALLPYFRRAFAGWVLRPGRVANAPAATWNELVLAGQIRLDTEIRRIEALRKMLPAPEPPRPAGAPAAPSATGR